MRSEVNNKLSFGIEAETYHSEGYQGILPTKIVVSKNVTF